MRRHSDSDRNFEGTAERWGQNRSTSNDYPPLVLKIVVSAKTQRTIVSRTCGNLDIRPTRSGGAYNNPQATSGHNDNDDPASTECRMSIEDEPRPT